MLQASRRLRGIAQALALLALGVSACGPLLPVAGPPPNVYTVRAKTGIALPQASVDWRLVIAEPSSPAWLDTDRIAVLPRPNELRYYANARWAERAPKLVQTVLVDTFTATGKIPVVGRERQGLKADYALKGVLQDFAARYEGPGAPKIHVRLQAIIAAEPKGEAIALKDFAETAIAESEDVLAVVATFERLLGRVAENVAAWSLALPLTKRGAQTSAREADQPRAAPREGAASTPLGPSTSAGQSPALP